MLKAATRQHLPGVMMHRCTAVVAWNLSIGLHTTVTACDVGDLPLAMILRRYGLTLLPSLSRVFLIGLCSSGYFWGVHMECIACDGGFR